MDKDPIVPAPAAAPAPDPASASPAVAAGSGRPRTRRPLTYAIIGAAVIAALAAIGIYRRGRTPSETGGPFVVTPTAKPTGKVPRVEVVFALDTTGSMSGLIEGAKRKIWSLASFIAQGRPTPELRVGLVAYRDVGDAYVTRVFDLDRDLDRVYHTLRGFRADGGGDTPEHVARALDEAVNQMSWSQESDVLKVIYLVGDAPPHTDYRDGYDYVRAARAAASRGIQLHTIQCGVERATESAWREIASLGQGQFMTIQQDGGMREERTAYDGELADLHDRLGKTAIGYGPPAAAAAVASAVAEAAAAPAPEKAARAGWMARYGKAVGGEGDLVESIAKGRRKLEDIDADDLPAELRSLSKDEQKKVISAKQKEREEINRRIDTLTRLRTAELDRGDSAAAAAGAPGGFDVAAKAALRKSARARPAAGVSF